MNSFGLWIRKEVSFLKREKFPTQLVITALPLSLTHFTRRRESPTFWVLLGRKQIYFILMSRNNEILWQIWGDTHLRKEKYTIPTIPKWKFDENCLKDVWSHNIYFYFAYKRKERQEQAFQNSRQTSSVISKWEGERERKKESQTARAPFFRFHSVFGGVISINS